MFHDSEAQKKFRKNTKVASITKRLKSIVSRLFHSLLSSLSLTTTNSPWMPSALSSSLPTFSSRTHLMLSSSIYQQQQQKQQIEMVKDPDYND
ncbi:12734_t:CDS:2 [Entrophospora sp. SA101]|nr:12734_t:CDS:2 [Entrophospora sp. SA101]